MKLTVFTPLFNRAHLLSRIYESLCKQTYKDFEWVIVDDGSSDNSKDVIDYIKKSKEDFPIHYFFQENGGKYRAINHGVKEAKGELFLILDSDDSLPEDSLETIFQYYEQIKDDKSFGGVAGYMAHHDGNLIGQCPTNEVVDATSSDYRYKYGATGDMCEVFRTDVLREFPFPEIPDEKFCPEMLILYRIARKYKLRWFHKVIYFRDYLDDGLTDRIVQIRMKSPILTMMSYAEKMGLDIPWKQKLKCAINYFRFSLCLTKEHEKKVLKENIHIPKISSKWLFCYPLGWLLSQKDKMRQ